MSCILSATLKATRCGRIVLLLLLVGWPHARGDAQEPPATPKDPVTPSEAGQLTLDTVQRRLKEIDGLPNLDDEAREELRGFYQEAVRDLTSSVDFGKRAAAFGEMSNSAAEKLKNSRFKKSLLGTTVTIDVPAGATLGGLESLLKVENEKLAEAKRQVEQLKAEPGRRQARHGEIASRMKSLRDSRQLLATELTATQGAADAKTSALATRLRAKMQAIDAELKLHEQELAAYTATLELLPLELELAERNASLGEKRVELWREKVEQQRTAKVKLQETNARLAAERATEALRPLAERNRELAQESGKLVDKISDVNREMEQSRQLLEETQQQFKVTKQKVDRVGLNYAIGLLLRKEDSSLPDVSKYKRGSREREEIIRDVQLRIIDLGVERSALTDVEYVESFLARMEAIPVGVTPANMEQEVTTLVEKRLELLTTLQQNEDAYFERLVDLDSTERQLCMAVAEYENYIDERVLWIRSSEPIAWADFERSITAFRWLTDREAWSTTLTNLTQAFSRQFLPALLVPLFWLILLLFQPRLRTQIGRVGEQAASGSCRSHVPTLMALAWTLLITVTWPALILILATGLAYTPAKDGLAHALSMGLVPAGFYYVTLEFLRQICRSKGLADSHFGWPRGVRVTLRKNLRWLMAISVPMVFAAATLYADAGSRSRDTLGTSHAAESAARLLVIVTLIAVAIFAHQTLRPAGLFFRSLEVETPQWRMYRWRRTVYTLALFLLGAFLLLAFAGYDFTVAHLSRRLFESVLLLEVLLVVMSLANRWLVIVRRRMAIQQAQQRRAQIAAQSQAADSLASTAISENAPDLTAIGEQSRRLLQSLLVIVSLGGLWYIWVDVIPALSFLDRFELWTVTSGATITKITVNHVIVAGVIAIATVLAARNIPGLLEIAVLSRLPLDAGNRHAIITICRYVLSIVGLILTFSAIGISWASYQWLVAAVTVGLGFGLQEIFANFVSGLIVLFEQPIRIGDVVTIGDVTGVVSKIRMRATTVTTWEHQEFIVPNREFITGRLLNWTLSNTVNRVVITVGVAYGTDPNVVKRILLKIARDHPNVLDDPAPSVTFAEFGASTLDIVLRCYLPDLGDRLSTIHDLNTVAQEKLDEAGIEFAFPTRELYIRSSPGNGGPSNSDPSVAGGHSDQQSR